MIFRQLQDNDWTFGKGKQDLASKDEAIKLNIKTKYNEWVGDCFFNKEAGIDWINRLEFGQRQLLEEDIKRLILACEGVVELVSFSTSFNENTREFSATYNIKTIYSPTVQDTL